MKYKHAHMIRDWLIFIRVVECRSFSAAARNLNLSVSSVSNSVAKLEKPLHVQLLRRNAHDFEVTPAGYVTNERAKALCLAYNELVDELAAPSKQIQVTLRLSAPKVLSESLIPRWIINGTVTKIWRRR